MPEDWIRLREGKNIITKIRYQRAKRKSVRAITENIDSWLIARNMLIKPKNRTRV